MAIYPSRAEIEMIGAEIIDGSIVVHSNFGPRLLESAYEACLTQANALQIVPHDRTSGNVPRSTTLKPARAKVEA